MTENRPSVALHDDPSAPEIFVTGYAGLFNAAGTIVVTLEAAKVDYSTEPGSPYQVVVGRLVMPSKAARSLALGLLDFLKKQGLDLDERIGTMQTQ